MSGGKPLNRSRATISLRVWNRSNRPFGGEKRAVNSYETDQLTVHSYVYVLIVRQAEYWSFTAQIDDSSDE